MRRNLIAAGYTLLLLIGIISMAGIIVWSIIHYTEIAMYTFLIFCASLLIFGIFTEIRNKIK